MAAANNTGTTTHAAEYDKNTNWVNVLMGTAVTRALYANAQAFEPRKLNPTAAEFIPAKLAADQAVKELMTLMHSPHAQPAPLAAPGNDLYKRADGRKVVLASSLDNHSALMDKNGYWEVPEAKPLIFAEATIKVFEKFGHKRADLEALARSSCSSSASEDEDHGSIYLGGSW